jgi:EAL domain-containing protein (putative c-di-GMP-specific phosphodiesterase class I)
VPDLDDPALVAREYATEERLVDRRLDVRADYRAENPEDVALAALHEAAPARVLEIGPGPGEFAARVRDELGASGADPGRLMVELTESSTLEDPALAEGLVRGLHALGLQIALDDFGTGYSSLSRLRELPVSTLKIDRAFMRDVPERPEAAAVVTAILQLARALGRTAVAEGVETEAQRTFLSREGCPLAQGFLLGAPAAPEALEALMEAPLRAAV